MENENFFFKEEKNENTKNKYLYLLFIYFMKRERVSIIWGKEGKYLYKIYIYRENEKKN